jgi:hypothetical protein
MANRRWGIVAGTMYKESARWACWWVGVVGVAG